MSVYLRAAKKIADTDPNHFFGACWALDQVGGSVRDGQDFERTFQPTTEERLRYGHGGAYWLSSMYADPKEAQTVRILALGFMHEWAKTELHLEGTAR